jgi:hypothetical protein
MAKKKKEKTVVAQPMENPPPPHQCPQGYVWSPQLGKCVKDIG